jgi:hypothetical protein
MARLGLVVGTFLLLMLATPATAGAGETWCDVDPLVVITTPRGNRVQVFVTTGARGVQHSPALLTQRITYTTRPEREGTATSVRMTVLVPNDGFAHGFAARTKASSGPLGSGTLHAAAEGIAGKPMQMSFTLNVP